MSEPVTAPGQSPRQSSLPRRHALAICALLLTLLCAAAAASAANGPPSPDKLRGPRTDRPGAFRPTNLKLLLVATLGGGGALAFFGYLYGREWYLNRGFRQYKIGLGASDRIVLPTATTDRTSWFKRGNRAFPSPASTVAAIAPEPAPPAPPNPPATEPKPAARTNLPGILNVRADDELHEILVDSKFVGMAPARLNLPAGPHWVELRRPGHGHYRREISVIAGAEVSLRPLTSEAEIY